MPTLDEFNVLKNKQSGFFREISRQKFYKMTQINDHGVNKNCCLCLIHMNIRSINNKIEELNNLFSDLNFKNVDILCISEHWLTTKCKDLLNRLEYFTISSFYGRNSRGGGVMIATKPYLTTKSRHDLNKLSIEKIFECCASEITWRDIKKTSLNYSYLSFT